MKHLSIAVTAVGYLIFAAAIGLAALVILAPRITGGEALAVLTGSMSPTIEQGSLVFVRPVAPDQLARGDVITFSAEDGAGRYITHRVVRRIEDGGATSFITKGDANGGNDIEPVPASAIRGEVWLSVPYLGALSEVVRTPVGIVGIVAVVAMWAGLTRILGARVATESKRPMSSAHRSATR